MTRQQLLGEVEELLRIVPSTDAIRENAAANLEWVGRAAAVIERWDKSRIASVMLAVDAAQEPLKFIDNIKGFGKLAALLQQARADLRMEVGQLSVAVPQGQVFDYFDELRKVIETARSEAFFVDPYLDADFVSRYLPHLSKGCGVRLLTAPRSLKTLLPAVDLFTTQSGGAIGVRVSDTLHDRYLFIDEAACYLSGASFKDGAKNAPAVLTQITDAFQSMFDTYQKLWASGNAER